jgi:hypothetical protein
MVGLPGDVIPDVGRLGNPVGAFGITSAREVAWTNSELFWHA